MYLRAGSGGLTAVTSVVTEETLRPSAISTKVRRGISSYQSRVSIHTAVRPFPASAAHLFLYEVIKSIRELRAVFCRPRHVKDLFGPLPPFNKLSVRGGYLLEYCSLLV